MSYKIAQDNPPAREDIRVAVFCALPVESDAVEHIFDVIYETKSLLWQKSDGDTNSYTTGRISGHYVVLVYLPGIGKVNAAATACNLKATFRNIELALAVGVCAGAPWTPSGDPIYLGDVIVSTQTLQADFGRERTDHFEMKTMEEGNLRSTPELVRQFLRKLQGPNGMQKLTSSLASYLQELLIKCTTEVPNQASDVLFDADTIHQHGGNSSSDRCDRPFATIDEAESMTCEQLGCAGKITRTRTRSEPSIHFGLVSSADTVKRNAVSRDEFVQKHKVLAFEMESAGIWNSLPTIVIKAVCDYADSHKNKSWQKYAASCAAAACQGVLDHWQSSGKTEHLPDPREELKAQYLESLRFPDMSSRMAGIELAQPGTCDWLFGNETFKLWHESRDIAVHHRVLWIKGKAGSGKSILMKHLFNSCAQLFPGSTTASYFFHARGTELQRNRLGMLQSLLHQIFTEQPHLLTNFVNGYAFHGEFGIRPWTVEELQNFLLLAAQQGWLKETVFLIDAVDECTETEARQLISFCDSLALNAVAKNLPVFICFSIRHFPNITSKRSLVLNIDSAIAHSQALEQFVDATLKIDNPALITAVYMRSNHVFLWAKLTGELLNSLYDEGAGDDDLSRQLSAVPTKLNEVFQLIFKSARNLNQTALLLQLVLYAAKPLTTSCLYLLFQAGMDPERIRPWNECGLSESRLQAFISTVSRGLVEVSGSRRRDISGSVYPVVEFFVQFIHETVREFLLNETQIADIPVGYFHRLEGHRIMVRCCLKSLTQEPIPKGNYDWINYPQIAYAIQHSVLHISNLRGESDFSLIIDEFNRLIGFYVWGIIRDRCPLWLKPMSQLMRSLWESISRGENQQAMLTLLARILLARALTEIGSRHFDVSLAAILDDSWDFNLSWKPLDSIMHGLEQVTLAPLNDESNPLFNVHRDYITSEGRSSAFSWFGFSIEPIYYLMTHHSERVSRMNQTCQSWLLIWAIQNRSPLAVKSLLTAGADPNFQIQYSVLPLELALHKLDHPFVFRDDVKIALTLVENGADPNARSSSGRPLFCNVVKSQQKTLISGFLRAGADPNMCDENQRPMLMNSLKSEEVTAMLLTAGANPNMTDSDAMPLLFVAISQTSHRVCKLLLGKGADLKKTVHGLNALHLAAMSGWEGLVDSLDAVDLTNAVTHRGLWDPLHVAAAFGSYEVVKKILPFSDLKRQNNCGRTALHEAVLNNHWEMAELLITSENINIQDKIGRTALHYTAAYLSLFEDITVPEAAFLRIMLNHGADPSIKDVTGENCWDSLQNLVCETSWLSNAAFSDVEPNILSPIGSEPYRDTDAEKGAPLGSLSTPGQDLRRLEKDELRQSIDWTDVPRLQDLFQEYYGLALQLDT